jgi:hypothetical protein
MKYQSTLYNPIYSVLGVSGVINGVEGFTVLDKTDGLDWGDKGPDVQTIACAACVRARELQELGVSLEQLEGGTLLMNCSEWAIEAYKLRPSPRGLRDGEVVLVLTEVVEVSEESE